MPELDKRPVKLTVVLATGSIQLQMPYKPAAIAELKYRFDKSVRTYNPDTKLWVIRGVENAPLAVKIAETFFADVQIGYQ